MKNFIQIILCNLSNEFKYKLELNFYKKFNSFIAIYQQKEKKKEKRWKCNVIWGKKKRSIFDVI